MIFDNCQMIEMNNYASTKTRCRRGKKVICTSTGNIYSSAMEAALACDMSESTISAACRKKGAAGYVINNKVVKIKDNNTIHAKAKWEYVK